MRRGGGLLNLTPRAVALVHHPSRLQALKLTLVRVPAGALVQHRLLPIEPQ